ncbi:MAG: serine/threonine protein kinase [Deltaproteobacteria bacterium]|nr:serine/threonine protein kinase [Deltaproteobacteria bacterium]
MTAETAPDPLLGRVLDHRYRLDAPLGGGGFGAVYEGFHLRLKRPVAVKVLHPEHVKDPELRKRFEREAESLAALSHPNVVPVFDYGVDDDLPFLVMEKLEGRPLAVAIAEGLAPGHAIAIAIDVASALSYAHAQGIVHRDLKPANIFLQAQTDGTEATRVLDFGLAKFVGRALPTGAADASSRGGRGDPTSPHASTLMGTPAYMSPEQCRGEAADARADVYSLALVLFESITGREPYEGSAVELLHHHISTPLPSVAALLPGAPWAGALDALLGKAAAKDRNARHGNGAELRDALVALADELPPGLVPAVRRSDGGTDGPISGKRSGPIATAPTLAAASGPVPQPSRVLALGAALVVGGLAIGGLGALYAMDATGDDTTGAPTLALASSVDASVPSDAGVPDAAIDDAGHDAAAEPDAALSDDAGIEGAIDEDAIDPWSRGVPPALRRYVERTSTRALTRRERLSMTRWIRTHAGDSRGPLALGHALMSQGARTEALEHYRTALATEAIARNDPRLRTNLLRIAAYDGSPREGADLAAETYGAELVPIIDGFLATLDPANPDGRRAGQRLRQLRARVSR